jgi:hypothetical protein
MEQVERRWALEWDAMVGGDGPSDCEDGSDGESEYEETADSDDDGGTSVEATPLAPQAGVCAACGTNTPQHPAAPWKPLMKCGRCHSVQYCGKDCQRADWPAHKASCAR